MRIRPFFWLLLITSCVAVLVFSALQQEHVPAVMYAHIDQQQSVAAGMMAVELHLTDMQGVPIEAAQVFSSARMTNMAMQAKQVGVSTLGQGNYRALLQLPMSGPWAISIEAHSEGFDALKQTLFIVV